uniref:Integrase catalytic domain-containing protein n=1 Tax=Trichuris muris TaxID=70415 RepID=A0A5S6QK45_TRIMR
MDGFSKFAEAFPIPNQEAGTVTKVIVNEFICRYGVPETIHTDQGAQFESALFQSMCAELGIHKTRTTPYHPSGNGQVERMNRTLGNMLAKSVEENQRQWDLTLPKVMMAYRASVQSSTRETPYAMVFGEQCRLPEDMFRPQESSILSPKDHVKQLRKALGRVHAVARRRLKEARTCQKQQHDKVSRGKPFRVGRLVFLESSGKARKGQCKKFAQPWMGPFRIIGKPSPVTYRIQHLRNRRDKQTVHFDRLKACPETLRLPTQRKGSPRQPVPMTRHELPKAIEFRPTILLEPDDRPPKPIIPEQRSADQGRPRREIRLPPRYRDYALHLPGSTRV